MTLSAPTGRPLISVVTPCYNRVGMVAEAVESVLDQGYSNFEHVVTDGGSTDGTLDVLRRYPHLRVQSEPDENLYDALNKGVRLARGEVIAHLNTDDYFPPDTFRRVAEAFAADPTVDVVFGGAALVEDGSAGRRVVWERTRFDQLNLTVRLLATDSGFTNTHFYRRRVYDRLGLYDVRYRVGADLDFMLRVAVARLKVAFLPVVVYTYRRHAGSLTFRADTANPTHTRDMWAISGRYARDRRIPRADRRQLARMHTGLSLWLLADAARRRAWADAARYSLDGVAVDPLWPVALAAATVPLMVRRGRKPVTG